MAALTEARDVYWCDGSDAEYDRLCAQLVAAGTLPEARPGAAPEQLPGAQQPERRRPGRGPHLHLLASARKTPARPTTGWRRRRCARCCRRPRRRHAAALSRLHARPHDVRRAVLDGPARLRIAHIGVELTDSAYVAVSMKIMTRMGRAGARRARQRRRLRALHAHRSARRSQPGEKDVAWPCNADQVHRPLPRDAGDLELRLGLRRQRAARQEVLRAAHRLGHGPRGRRPRQPGWLAEHMLILGVTSPEGKKHHVAAAFPSACGKTNFAMLIPPPALSRLEGDDDRRRHRLDQARPGRAALRDQSRGRLLRRRPGHQREDQPELHGEPRSTTRSSPTSRSPTTATSGGKA